VYKRQVSDHNNSIVRLCLMKLEESSSSIAVFLAWARAVPSIWLPSNFSSYEFLTASKTNERA